jgi:hypothetical protein
MIALAGRQNAGKTSLAQEFIEENIDKNPFPRKIRYIVNESGRPEIRYRLENNMNIRPDKWRECVDIANHSCDYADYVDPEAINVIDYMTDYENAWGIGKEMEEVYDVMRDAPGMVWVNLQKDQEIPTDRYAKDGSKYTTGRDTGRGGSVTLDKPRLYMSMDYDKIKIVKCKFPGGNNPWGMIHDFSVSDDGTIVPRGGWYYPEKKKSRYVEV